MSLALYFLRFSTHKIITIRTLSAVLYLNSPTNYAPVFGFATNYDCTQKSLQRFSLEIKTRIFPRRISSPSSLKRKRWEGSTRAHKLKVQRHLRWHTAYASE